MEEVGNRVYKVTFTPQSRGKHRVYVYLNGMEVKGSPFSLRIGKDVREKRTLGTDIYRWEDYQTEGSICTLYVSVVLLISWLLLVRRRTIGIFPSIPKRRVINNRLCTNHYRADKRVSRYKTLDEQRAERRSYFSEKEIAIDAPTAPPR